MFTKLINDYPLGFMHVALQDIKWKCCLTYNVKNTQLFWYFLGDNSTCCLRFTESQMWILLDYDTRGFEWSAALNIEAFRMCLSWSVRFWMLLMF